MASLRPFRLDVAKLDSVGEYPLASGAFGDVWRGQYGSCDVAIKRIKQNETSDIVKFIDEKLLLASLHCEAIVTFMGVVWYRPTDLACVVEYMDLGDLRTILATKSPAEFTWDTKERSVARIVQGLLYLHTFHPPIIHRDLKSRNVLLDTTKGTKLADFGQSRAIDASTLTSDVGTYQWMAPEVIEGKRYSVAADVYSFGVVLSEFSTHRVPYSDAVHPRTLQLYNHQYVLSLVTSGSIKPTLDATTTPEWALNLARRCCATNPVDRPDMQTVATMLAQKLPCF
ncbi:protein kinase [Achlya hypogyna]|uniref:Protein kinase n=1 Tax=Achlya hypogyna TaxID=1202772 RepID=A0A1V9Z1E4_ACHHY|nr:protein kinase [Achlya hypogyna]